MFLSEKQLLVLLSAMMLLSSFITFIGILYFGKRPAYGRYSSESKLKNVFVIKKVGLFHLYTTGSYTSSTCLVPSRSSVLHSTYHWCLASWSAPYNKSYCDLYVYSSLCSKVVEWLVSCIHREFMCNFRSFIYPYLIRGG